MSWVPPWFVNSWKAVIELTSLPPVYVKLLNTLSRWEHPPPALAAISCDSNVTVSQAIGAAVAAMLNVNSIADPRKIRFDIEEHPPRSFGYTAPRPSTGLSYSRLEYTLFL